MSAGVGFAFTTNSPDQTDRLSQAPSPRVVLTPGERAWLAQQHTIRVGFWQHPPFFYVKDGKVVGIAVDLLNEVAERTGLTFQYEPNPDHFADVLKGLIDHEGPDLVGALMPTPEREESMLFTEPYFNSPRYIFTRDDAPFVSSIDNLIGERIVVVEDYVIHSTLVENHPNIDLLVCGDNEEALRAVASGEAGAFIGDLVATPAMINEFGLKNLKAACPSGLPDHHLAMAVRDDWPELRDVLSKALQAIPAEEKAAIINRWSTVRVEHGVRSGDVVKWGLGVAGAALVIVMVFAVWNRTLNRRVRERTAEALVREERFRATFEQAAVGIAHVSPDGRFLRINRKFCDIVGYSPQELSEKTFQEITHPEDLPADVDQVHLLLRGEIETYSTEKRYLRQDGDQVWVNLTASLVRNEAGDPQWFVSVVEDISQRKQAADQLQKISTRLQLATAATGIGLYELAPQTLEIYYSPEWKQQLGYADHELPNRFEEWESRLHPDDREATLEEADAYMSGEASEFSREFRLRHKDGSYRWIFTRADRQLDESGRPKLIHGCHVDITELKQAELQLREHQQRLKALAAQLTVSEERERSRVASELHDQLGQNLALARLQLSTVRASAADSRQASLLDEVSAALLKAIQDTRHLIFDLSSPTLNQLGLEAAISEWLEEEVEERYHLQTDFVARGPEPTLGEDVRALLFRSVRELLTNVIKHAQATGVHVILEQTRREVRVSVEDDGSGYDPDRSMSKARNDGGFGLFSIQERMSDLGGRLEIDSVPGRGLTATLILPLEGEWIENNL